MNTNGSFHGIVTTFVMIFFYFAIKNFIFWKHRYQTEMALGFHTISISCLIKAHGSELLSFCVFVSNFCIGSFHGIVNHVFIIFEDSLKHYLQYLIFLETYKGRLICTYNVTYLTWDHKNTQMLNIWRGKKGEKFNMYYFSQLTASSWAVTPTWRSDVSSWTPCPPLHSPSLQS